jgi:hypothetical protein
VLSACGATAGQFEPLIESNERKRSGSRQCAAISQQENESQRHTVNNRTRTIGTQKAALKPKSHHILLFLLLLLLLLLLFIPFLSKKKGNHLAREKGQEIAKKSMCRDYYFPLGNHNGSAAWIVL